MPYFQLIVFKVIMQFTASFNGLFRKKIRRSNGFLRTIGGKPGHYCKFGL
jgi:hypothetical protein